MAVETFVEKYFRNEGIAIGEERGRVAGRAEEQENLAVRMLKAGRLALEEIAEYSGLTLRKVKALQRKFA